MQKNVCGLGQLHAVSLGWDRILVGTAAQPENRRFLGLSVAEGARRYGFPDAEALAAHLMHRGRRLRDHQPEHGAGGRRRRGALPYSMLISDALYAATDTPHPRLLGAFPRFLREYAFARGVVPPEEAVRKMTALPAERFGFFRTAGASPPAAAPDLLLFDPRAFTDNADFSGRSDFSSGLSLSLIGGEAVVRGDKLTGKRPGQWLRAQR